MKAKKTIYASMDEGGKVKVRKPEEYRGQTKRAKRKEAIAKAKRAALEQSKRTGKRGTVYSDTVGSESLREGQVRRRGRRLERVAKKAGMTRDEAYTVGSAESKAVSQKDAGNQKASEKALKASKLLDKYRGQKKVTAKARPEKKRTEPARGTKEPRARRVLGELPTFTKRSGKGRQAAGRRRAINEAINKSRANRGKR